MEGLCLSLSINLFFFSQRIPRAEFLGYFSVRSERGKANNKARETVRQEENTKAERKECSNENQVGSTISKDVYGLQRYFASILLRIFITFLLFNSVNLERSSGIVVKTWILEPHLLGFGLRC